MNTTNQNLSFLKHWSWSKKVFFALVFFTLFNLGGILPLIFDFEIPLNLFAVVLACIICIPKIKNNKHHYYFVFASALFVFFLFFGFLPSTAQYNMSMFRLTLKFFIVIILFPYLAVSIVEKDDLPVYQKAFTYFMFFAASFTIIQFFFYQTFKPILMAIHNRPAAFWINPNAGSFMLMCFLFLSLFFSPDKIKYLRIAQLLALVAIILTFSRMSILLTFVGVLIYLIAVGSKKLWLLFLFAVVFIYILMGVLYSTFNENQKGRLNSFVQASSRQKYKSDTRMEIWKTSFHHISEAGFFLGSGHSTMNFVAKHEGRKVGPHNFYLWIWGNSGFITLLAFIAWFIVLIFMALSVDDKLPRISLALLVFAFVFTAISDHSFLLNQGTGVIIAFFMLFGLAFKIENNRIAPFSRNYLSHLLGRVLFMFPRHRFFNSLKAIYIRCNGGKIGSKIVFYPRVRISTCKNLDLAHHVDLALGVYVDAEEGVRIGDRTLIGYNTRIFSSTAFVSKELLKDYPQAISKGKVIIEQDVWIGAGCIVFPGVTIGEGAVVAGGSVVVENIEPFAIVGGRPARLIKART